MDLAAGVFTGAISDSNKTFDSSSTNQFPAGSSFSQDYIKILINGQGNFKYRIRSLSIFYNYYTASPSDFHYGTLRRNAKHMNY